MSGIFPDKLKIAKVTPIYQKQKYKKQVTNYRQTSVLPVVSKIIETVIADQLNAYFIKKTSVQLTAIWVQKKFFH